MKAEIDSKYILSNEFTFGAYWWLPNSDDMFYGTIYYKPNDAPLLKLEGSFSEFTPNANEYLSNVLIHGRTANGISITLVDAYQKTNRMFLPGLTTSEFFCSRLLIGEEHIFSNNAKFESTILEFDSLSAWLTRAPFEEKTNTSKKKDGAYQLTYKRQKTINISIESIQSTIKLYSSISVDGNSHMRKAIHKDYIKLRPKKKQNLSWYLDIIFNLRILLSFLIGQPINPISIKLINKKKAHKRIGNVFQNSPVSLCIPHYKEEVISNLEPNEILFPFVSIKRKIKNCFKNWFQKKDLLKTTNQLLFGMLIQKNLPIEFKYMALIQAFEAYHRTYSKGKYLPNTKYEQIKKTITDAFPSSISSAHRDALKSRIKYGNEYSLRKRFDNAIKSMPKSLSNKILANDPKYISKIIDTRNYLTHRDESNKTYVMDAHEINDSIERLKILILSLILEEIGIDYCEFENAISRNWKTRRVLNIAR